VSAQEQQARVDAAVRKAAMSVIGLTLAEQLETIMSAGFAAVLAEVGPRPGEPEDEAPPVRELPKATGSLVVAFHVAGRDVPGGVPLLRAGREWSALDERHLAGFPVLRDTDIEEWAEARVVRDDEHGPAQALHRIAHQEFDRKVAPEDVIDELREVAAEALRRLDGGES
jgi:hypothetical protein